MSLNMTSMTINPETMEIVETEYLKLHQTIDEMSIMIGESIDRKKEEVERIHKTQIEKLQEELNSVKLEKVKLEDDIATNERASLLENERDWYKRQAVHLDKLVEQMKIRQNELLGQLDDSEQDRKCIKLQLEKVMKKNRTFEQHLKLPGAQVENKNDENSEREDQLKLETTNVAEGIVQSKNPNVIECWKEEGVTVLERET